MEITLTWDLFVIVFFAMVMTYSFIIGKDESVKIIIASYIAIVAVQGVGNIIERVSGQSHNVLSALGITFDITMLSTTKLLLFIGAIIFLAVRGGLEIEYSKERGNVLTTIITGAFGFATAGLLLSTLLTYIAGTAILDIHLAKTAAVSPIIEQSKLMKAMIINQDVWFSLPALLIIAVGFINNE